MAVRSDGQIIASPEDVVYSVARVGTDLINRGRSISEILDAIEAETKRLRASMRGSQAMKAARPPVHPEGWVERTFTSTKEDWERRNGSARPLDY